MSTWSLIVKTLHQHGPMTIPELQHHITTRSDLYGVAWNAHQLGLVTLPGGGHGGSYGSARQIQLTQRGIDFAEGRIEQSMQYRKDTHRISGRRWQATWLMALPRGVRIEQPQQGAS